MQNRLRFFYIAIIAHLFTGNVAYAHNEEAQTERLHPLIIAG